MGAGRGLAQADALHHVAGRVLGTRAFKPWDAFVFVLLRRRSVTTCITRSDKGGASALAAISIAVGQHPRAVAPVLR